jgi:hypothetical protein
MVVAAGQLQVVPDAAVDLVNGRAFIWSRTATRWPSAARTLSLIMR